MSVPPSVWDWGDAVAIGEYTIIPGYERFTGIDAGGKDIGPVPGVGPILGIRLFRETVYATRSDGEVPRLYAATATGWELVTPIWDAVLAE